MPETVSQLRVMTWNLHACVGIDGKLDVNRTGKIIHQLSPDIATFQEVDLRRKSPAHADVGKYLCNLVGHYSFEAWAISAESGAYGQVLASRFPLAESHVHDISVAGYEPRKIMEAQICLPACRLRVIATHLGFWRKERKYQLDMLRNVVMAVPDLPCVILGDLNLWPTRKPVQREFNTFNGEAIHGSYPSILPILAPDRIVCGSGTRLLSSRAVQEARIASDHLPILARIEIAVRDH